MELQSRIAGRDRTLSVTARAVSESGERNERRLCELQQSTFFSPWKRNHPHCSSTADDVSAFNVAATALRRAFFCTLSVVCMGVGYVYIYNKCIFSNQGSERSIVNQGRWFFWFDVTERLLATQVRVKEDAVTQSRLPIWELYGPTPYLSVRRDLEYSFCVFVGFRFHSMPFVNNGELGCWKHV